jgi:DNA-binding SARP family transcriptional activator/tetratricopeptide (TPR) repeat protein
MLELRTLGTLTCRKSGGGELHSLVAQPKRVALLVYLAVARPRGFHRRDTLLGLFWPDSSESRARAALSQAVYTLRRMLGEDVIVTRGDDDLAVGSGEAMCDAVAFDEALAVADRERALELYGGEFLKGFYLDECAEFEQWVYAERSRLRESAVVAAWSLADERSAIGNTTDAVHWARRAVSIVPDEEPAVRRLMQLLATSGDRAGALREFDSLSRRMAELELPLAADTHALADEIRAGGTPTKPAAPAPRATEAPLVAARADLPAAAERASAGPRPRPRRARWLAAAGVVLLAAGAGAAALATRGDDRPFFDEKRVLVAELTNETADPALGALGRVSADWIAQGLKESGLVEVVPAVTAMRHAQGLDIALEAPPAVANRALAEETGAGILISGAYYKEGDDLIMQARITDVRSGQLRRALEPVRGAAQQPMSLVAELRRRTLGALASLTDARLASWSAAASQPPSYEAYQLYAEGLDEFFRTDSAGFRKASVLFREAAALDPSFTSPLIWATFAHMNRGEHDVADSLTRVVERSRVSLPAWDRAVLAYQQATIRSDLSGAYNAARRVAELAPQSEWHFLLAIAALATNRPREAVAALRSVDPDRGWIRTWPAYWIQLATAEHFSGEYRAELATLQRGSLRHPDQRQLAVFRLRTLGAMGRMEEGLAFADSLAASRSDPMIAADSYLMLARELRTHGRPELAVRAATHGLRVLDDTPQPQFARARYIRGLLLLEARRWADAYAVGEMLPQPGPLGTNAGLRGVAAARLGRPGESLAALQSIDISPAQPEPLEWRGTAKLWAAAIHAHLGETERAIELVRAALREGASITGRGVHGHHGLAPLQGHPSFEALLKPRG